MNPKIRIKLDAGATMPRYAHSTDVGADVTALRTWLVQGDGTEHELQTIADCTRMKLLGIDCAKLKIDTGVHAQPPAGYYIELVPNSRIAKTPFQYANSIGIIDPTYTGSMRVVLNVVNSITPDDLAHFLPGRVVGQIIVRHRHEADFVQVDTLEATERGAGGFGSTAQMLPLDSWHTIPSEKRETPKCYTCRHFIGPTTLGAHPRECSKCEEAPEQLNGCEHFCHSKNAENERQNDLLCTDGQQMHQDLFNTNGN